MRDLPTALYNNYLFKKKYSVHVKQPYYALFCTTLTENASCKNLKTTRQKEKNFDVKEMTLKLTPNFTMYSMEDYDGLVN
jgi:hypothetical protein